MGADNWAVCPKCKRVAEASKEKERKHAQKSYGKVTPEEWRELVRIAELPLEMPTALREDYELGTNEDGLFYVIYRCSCQDCDFRHEFKHESQVDSATGGS